MTAGSEMLSFRMAVIQETQWQVSALQLRILCCHCRPPVSGKRARGLMFAVDQAQDPAYIAYLSLASA